MSELSRADAIKVLENCAFYLNDAFRHMRDEHVEQFKKAYELAIDSLKTDEMYNLLAEKGADICERWISCSERLPDKAGEYLVTYRSNLDGYRRVSIKMYSPNLHNVDKFDFPNKKRPGWYDYDSEYGHYEWNDVIAWMPIPEVYKGGMEDDSAEHG